MFSESLVYDKMNISNDSILCENITILCRYEVVSKFTVTLNLFSIIISALHIGLLTNVHKLLRKKYYWILIHIGVSDIVTSISYILTFNCEFTKFIFTRTEDIARNIILGVTTFTISLATIRSYILTLANYERYTAICSPFSYNTNKIVKHMEWCFIATWMIIPAIYTVLQVSTSHRPCLNDFGTVLLQPSIPRAIVIACLITPSILVTATCLGKFGLELKKMNKRFSQPITDPYLRKAGTYVLVTSFMFYLSNIPGLVCFCLNPLSNYYDEVLAILTWFAGVYHALYGIFNVFLYVYLNPNYWKYLAKLLRCKKLQAKFSQNQTLVCNEL
ncbi:hypothetical protein EB796_010762 [Bugula neritina]|uniref:G-protein coupled receptors family 1 profile domain-containing protein n=1 Tax=Bugula neritina TaxID=10212 RepID=A0A7J7JWZ2_BUGNE|nr:hypothetical protein EB796_010762 [Bugula neritina]